MPLDLLGVYGVSRALSEPVGLLVGRLNHVIIFPLIASSAGMPRARLRAQLVSVRLIFVLVAAIGVSALAALQISWWARSMTSAIRPPPGWCRCS